MENEQWEFEAKEIKLPVGIGLPVGFYELKARIDSRLFLMCTKGVVEIVAKKGGKEC